MNIYRIKRNIDTADYNHCHVQWQSQQLYTPKHWRLRKKFTWPLMWTHWECNKNF